MAKEIERRFLVDNERLPKLSKGKLQIQGYLNNSPSNQPEIRIRSEENKAYITLKTFVTPTTREEFEYEIPTKDAERLLELTTHKVRKMRHHIKLDDKSWIVDIFQDANSPLILADIELKQEDDEFDRPLWATQEITSDLRFTAIALAFKPYSQWKPN